MEKISLRDFKKHLSELPHNEVIGDVITFYKDIPAVREYYLAKLCPTAEVVLLEKYKKIIENEFFPDKGVNFAKTRASVVRQAISDFKKLAQSPQNVVDLLFYYVSIGASYSKVCGGNGGDIEYPAFYRSLESAYKQALQFSVKHGHDIKEKAEKLQQECQGLGYSCGFSDSIDDIFDSYFAEIEGLFTISRIAVFTSKR